MEELNLKPLIEALNRFKRTKKIIAIIECKAVNPKFLEYETIEELKMDIKYFNDYIGPMSYKITYIHPEIKEEINKFIERIIG